MIFDKWIVSDQEYKSSQTMDRTTKVGDSCTSMESTVHKWKQRDNIKRRKRASCTSMESTVEKWKQKDNMKRTKRKDANPDDISC